MTQLVNHDLKLAPTARERARQDFVSDLRGFLLHDMAGGLKAHYESKVEPHAVRTDGAAPSDSHSVHKAIKPSLYFKFYSSMRVSAQEMVWGSVRSTLERTGEDLKAAAGKVGNGNDGGNLKLDSSLKVPDYVDAVDVHLMPGNYHGHGNSESLAPGALYDNGLSVFSMGLMGSELSDIGRSVAGFVARRFPEFKPADILDLGCTIGHNTCPWKETFPNAKVTGIDVAAPSLRYGHARARSMGYDVAFEQADSTALPFEDNSMDVVFSSMFLHELPVKAIKDTLKEAYRVLKPGGLMLHMELPPNDQMTAFDGFYLDWDCWYNQEPFYKGYRDLDNAAICEEAGFDPSQYMQFVIPSREGYGEETFDAAARGDAAGVDNDLVGRLAAGVQWFVFGAWK